MNDADTAWGSLRDRLSPFVRRRVADRDAADDIVQETLTRAVAAFGASPDASTVDRWAYRTARNLIIDRYRRMRQSSPADVEALTSPQMQPESARAHEMALGACAAAMLGQLEPTYRQAVTLADLQGISQQELAEQLGVSVSGIKSRVQRGRAKLRGMLLECCRIDTDRRGNVIDHQCAERSSQYCST